MLIFFLFFCLNACESEKLEPEFPKVLLSDIVVTEGNPGSTVTVARFTLRLKEKINTTQTIKYRTVDASAFSGLDYKEKFGTVLFSSSQKEQQIEIEIISDDKKEGDEYFKIVFFNPNDSLPVATARATIINDDDDYDIAGDGYLTPDTYDGWDLIWNEAFDGSDLDTTVWTYALGNGCPDLCGWGNNELEYYTNRNENLRLEGGKLIIEAHQESWEGHDYTSARITTKNKKAFQFGRIDIRARMPEGEGIWPALWMLGANIEEAPWPVCGEIDIAELVGFDPTTIHGTVHFGQFWPNNQFNSSYFSIAPMKFSDQFHVYSLVWEENVIWWYVDDIVYKEITSSDLNGQDYPFNADFFFIFNLAVGGNWPGPPDHTTVFPQKLEVDYIRVFKKK